MPYRPADGTSRAPRGRGGRFPDIVAGVCEIAASARLTVEVRTVGGGSLIGACRYDPSEPAYVRIGEVDLVAADIAEITLSAPAVVEDWPLLG